MAAYMPLCAHGRNPRRRFADLLIAAVALANQLPLLTRNATDFAGLDDLIEVIEIWGGAIDTHIANSIASS